MRPFVVCVNRLSKVARVVQSRRTGVSDLELSLRLSSLLAKHSGRHGSSAGIDGNRERVRVEFKPL